MLAVRICSGDMVVSQPYAFARLICCRARKTMRSPASISADTVHDRKATLRESMRGAYQKVSSPTRCCFAWQARIAERRSDRPASSRHHHRFLSAHARRLMALLCRRLRRGADGQKLGAAPAYASYAWACGALRAGGCRGRASDVAFRHVERNPCIFQVNHPSTGAGRFFLLKALPGTRGIVFIPQRLGRFNLAVSPVSRAVVFG